MKRDFSAIRRIIAGTTGLVFGTIADGYALVRSGTSIVGLVISTARLASALPKTDSTYGLLDNFSTGGLSTFGDGSDGDGDIAGNTTLTREMYYNDLTIRSTGVLSPAGFRIFVRGVLTIEAGGVIQDDGTSATTSTGGSGLGARGTLNSDSGAGGNGRNTTGNGSGGANPTSQIFNNTSTPNGGGGGDATGGNVGGAASNVTIRTAVGGSIKNLTSASLGHCAAGNGVFQPGGGGGGGGAGGCNVGTGTAVSGGGGGGGGSVCITCRVLNSAGVIRANGGNGAAASGITGNGVAGGGGGGGGGWVSIVAGLVLAQGTVQASGGTGGAGGGTGGLSGANGSSGYTQVISMV